MQHYYIIFLGNTIGSTIGSTIGNKCTVYSYKQAKRGDLL